MKKPVTLARAHDMLETALGEQILAALQDPDVTEVSINPDGALWIEYRSRGRIGRGSELSAHEVERVIRLVATHLGRDVNGEAPIVSAELPLRGERFEGVLPPIVQGPCFSIRKPADRIWNLDEYVERGTMTDFQACYLKGAVKQRKNILVVGGTASGKTTLVNALMAQFIGMHQRILILEDTRELQCSCPDVVQLRTKPGIVSMGDLVRSTLRLRPDRIVVGEVRGPDALDMLKAWNTGHPGGIATLHANSAREGLHRLEQLIGEGVTNIPHEMIGSAIDRIVFISNRGGVRRVEEILNVEGWDYDGYRLEDARPQPMLFTSNPTPISN